MMAFSIRDKLKSLKGLQRTSDVAPDVAPTSRPDVAPDVVPDVAVDATHDVAGAPARARGTSTGTRRIAKVSTRLSQAAMVSLVALAATPLVQQRLSWAARTPLQSVASHTVAAQTIAAQTVAAQTVAAQTVAAPPVAPAQIAQMQIPAAPVPPLKPEVRTAPAVFATADAARPVAITVTPETPARVQLKLPKGKLKTLRARAGAPAVTLKSIRTPGPMLASIQFDAPSATVIDPDPLPVRSVKLTALKSKTVSERRAKPAPPIAASAKPAVQVAALDPKSDGANTEVPKIGVATRREEATVVEAWAQEQIAEGRKACQALLTGTDIVTNDAPPIKEGACGAPAPVVVRRFGSPQIDVHPPAMLTCTMAASLNTWLTKSVQPAALENFGVPVVRLLSASSYACRNRYGQSSAPLSEHALVNALDLSGFVLADGRTVRVVESWGAVARDAKPEPDAEPNPETAKAAGNVKIADAGGAPVKARDLNKAPVMPLGARPASEPVATASPLLKSDAKPDDKSKRMAFLKRVHRDACETFGTVLGPEANDAHRNHFHLDMMARRRIAFCQ